MMERIIGTGSCLPERIVENEELSRRMDTSDEWIRSRTGIERRHVAEQETTVSLAVTAARRAIEDAGIAAEQIDLIIVATASAEQLFPCVACEVQAAIGAVHAGCFDLNAACTGFLTAYQMAAGQIQMGAARMVLVIGAEVMSRLVDWTDRSTCILFGDGAGAVLLEAQEQPDGRRSCAVLRADGTRGHALTCNSGLAAGQKPFGDVISMDGRGIYQFAVKKVPEVVDELLEQAQCQAEEIDYYILHQANSRIIESIARHLRQPSEKFPVNLTENGNMSAASIPVLLDDLNRKGKLKRGMQLLLAGFGAGLTWGGILTQW